MATSLLKSPSTVYSPSITSRILATSSSVRSLTRVSGLRLLQQESCWNLLYRFRRCKSDQSPHAFLLVNQRLKYEPCVFCTSIFTFIKLNFLKQRFRVSQLPGSLALSLLMLRVLTNNADDTLSLNNLALFADRLY